MATYRFDEDFDGFMEDFGEAFENTLIGIEVIEAYRDKLPEQLFAYWRELGSCGFGEGRFWMTDPAEYDEMLNDWLEGTVFEDRNDLSVIARTAFGVLYVWAKGKGNVMKIYPMTGAINYFKEADANDLSIEDENKKMRYFWGFLDLGEGDYEDENDKPLFDRAFKKFGRLHADEMYGFSHSPAMGGKENFDNLDRVKLGVYHDIARQLGGVQVVVIEL
jgi:hypothetical protein